MNECMYRSTSRQQLIIMFLRKRNDPPFFITSNINYYWKIIEL